MCGCVSFLVVAGNRFTPRRNRFLEFPAKKHSTKNTNQNTNHQEFPPNYSKTKEFPPNRQNWVPTERYSTKNTNQNTNHRVRVPVTYQYQPDSQYWWKFPPLPPHLPTIPTYLYIAIAYSMSSGNDIKMYIRLCVMSIHIHWKRNAEAQLKRRQNPAYRIQEQVANTEQRQIACTNHENRTQEQVADMEQRRIAL